MEYGVYTEVLEDYDHDKLEKALSSVSDEDLYEVVCAYCQENGYEIPFDDYLLEDYIESLEPYDAFMAGMGMNGSLNGGLYIFNGYGNIETITESEFAHMYRDEPNLIDFIIENDLIDDIGLDSEDFIIEDDYSDEEYKDSVSDYERTAVPFNKE